MPNYTGPCPPCPEPEPCFPDRSYDIIEAFTVSIGYADVLRFVIEHNIGLFDRWIIGTSPSDEETRELCRKWGIYCLLSDDHKRHGAQFNKGRLIERMLHMSANQAWRVHVDGDMILPTSFRNRFRAAEPDSRCIYGVDRVMIKSYEEYLEFRDSGYQQHDYHCRIKFPPGLPVGTRWGTETVSYAVIGAFQCWHSDSDTYRGVRIRPYPDRFQNDACRTDLQFSCQWDRRQRLLLPEIVAVHLESEPAKLGANWKGRTTKRFGP